MVTVRVSCLLVFFFFSLLPFSSSLQVSHFCRCVLGFGGVVFDDSFDSDAEIAESADNLHVRCSLSFAGGVRGLDGRGGGVFAAVLFAVSRRAPLLERSVQFAMVASGSVCADGVLAVLDWPGVVNLLADHAGAANLVVQSG